jgi:quercetin dioxygenase-like cupin family protein
MKNILTDAQLADEGVDVAHHFSGKEYVKETFIPVGTELAQHAHEHPHLSYLVKGRVMLTIDGASQQVDAPRCILLEKGKVHGVRAMTDAIWLCIWSVPEGLTGENVDAAITGS